MAYRPLERLLDAVDRHEKWRTKDCLNLSAAENRASPLVRSMYASDLGNRYTDPEKFHRGTRYLDEIQTLATEIACKVFRAKHADVRPLSGHIADMAVLLSLTTPGDRIVSISPEDGGYPGIAHEGLGGILGLKNSHFPFDQDKVNIDARKSALLLRSVRPKAAFFGSSFIPFPHPIRELSTMTDGAKVYDGSHVLGLIAGGEFQDPLREGCSLLIGSTHKSFPGPQGGIILSNDEKVFSEVSSLLYPGIVDNVHPNRVAALAVSLLEMMRFGKDYASAVVRNSQALAAALVGEGVKVRGSAYGFTKSHQVLLDCTFEEAKILSRKLEKANIISDDGGRLGTSEVTRMGCGPGEMERIASLAADILLQRRTPSEVARDVRRLVREYQEPKFVLRSVPRLP